MAKRLITYRQARRSDMLACARVFVRTARDLARRQGKASPPMRPRDTARAMGAKELFVVVPGVNAGALGAFFDAGLKTEFFGAWMSAKPFGAFEGYMLAGGMLL